MSVPCNVSHLVDFSFRGAGVQACLRASVLLVRRACVQVCLLAGKLPSERDCVHACLCA
jgi:hypothetical protein